MSSRNAHDYGATWDKSRGPKVCIARLQLAGVCCTNEVILVRKLLDPMPGVLKVSVNIIGQLAVVHYDSTRVSLETLVNTLNGNRLGCTVREHGTGATVGQDDVGSALPLRLMAYHAALLLLFLGALALHLYGPAIVSDALLALFLMAALPPIFWNAACSLGRHIVDINCLVLLAVGSTIALRQPLDAALVTLLFGFAGLLEHTCMALVRGQLADYHVPLSRTAILAEPGSKGKEVNLEDVMPGTLLAIRTGDQIPLDGVVAVGSIAVDESAMTGESMPVQKQPGDTLYAGTVAHNGYAEMRTTTQAADSTINIFQTLVEDSLSEASGIDLLVDRFAHYYTPTLLCIAAAMLLLGITFGHRPLSKCLQSALLVLVLACPCSLVLAAPVANMCAIATAARAHAIIKSGGAALERLASLKVLALDKTGTLTEGALKVTDVHVLDHPSASAGTLEGSAHSVQSSSSRCCAKKSCTPSVCVPKTTSSCCTATPHKDPHTACRVPAVDDCSLKCSTSACGTAEPKTTNKGGCCGGPCGVTHPPKPDVMPCPSTKTTCTSDVNASGTKSSKCCGGPCGATRQSQAGSSMPLAISPPPPACCSSGASMSTVDKVSCQERQRDVLRLCAALEMTSSHPLAHALVAHYFSSISGGCLTASTRPNEDLPLACDVTSFTGRGVQGTVEGVSVVVGTAQLMEELGIDGLGSESEVSPWHQWILNAKTVVFVATHGRLTMALALADQLRSDAPCAVHQLRNLGVSVALLTGDNEACATAVADASGISEVLARMSPGQKKDWVINCQRDAKRVGMVGDGINDSLALSQADVGIAMGAGGSALAAQAAGIVLLSDRLAVLPAVIALARRCLLVTKLNLILAVALKGLMVFMNLWYPLPVWSAVVADMGSLVLVVALGMSLLNPLRPPN